MELNDETGGPAQILDCRPARWPDDDDDDDDDDDERERARKRERREETTRCIGVTKPFARLPDRRRPRPSSLPRDAKDYNDTEIVRELLKRQRFGNVLIHTHHAHT